jgi:hypothetical protein
MNAKPDAVDTSREAVEFRAGTLELIAKTVASMGSPSAADDILKAADMIRALLDERDALRAYESQSPSARAHG